MYIYSESLLNTLYIDIKNRSQKTFPLDKIHYFAFGSSNSPEFILLICAILISAETQCLSL